MSATLKTKVNLGLLLQKLSMKGQTVQLLIYLKLKCIINVRFTSHIF